MGDSTTLHQARRRRNGGVQKGTGETVSATLDSSLENTEKLPEQCRLEREELLKRLTEG
jgi:hypothetical protein